MNCFLVPGSETPTLLQLTEQSWIWLVDLQRTGALLLGQCLGTILIGDPPIKEEVYCNNWLQNVLFSRGLKLNNIEVELVYEVAYFITTKLNKQIFMSIENLPSEYQSYCKFALNLPCQYDEACSVQEGDPSNANCEFYDFMVESEGIDSWDLEDDDEHLLDVTIRCFLITALKHLGLLQKPPNHPFVKEVYKCVLNLRQKVLHASICSKLVEEDEKSFEKIQETSDKYVAPANPFETFNIDRDVDNYKFKFSCQKILQRSLFMLLFVEGKLQCLCCKFKCLT